MDLGLVHMMRALEVHWILSRVTQEVINVKNPSLLPRGLPQGPQGTEGQSPVGDSSFLHVDSFFMINKILGNYKTENRVFSVAFLSQS